MVPAHGARSAVGGGGAWCSLVHQWQARPECTGLMKGVASSLLLCVLETPLAFTSAPGSTVMTDLKDSEAPAGCLTPEGIPEVHPISQDPLHYSITSSSAVQKIRELETIIAVDPGKEQNIHAIRARRNSSLMPLFSEKGGMELYL